MRVALIALTASVVACGETPAPQATADDVRAAIEEQNRAFGEAVRAGDSAAIGALYTADGAVLPPNGAKVSGRAAIADFWGSVLAGGIAGVVLTTEEVAYAGGDNATEIGSAVLTAKDGAVADEAKYAVLWKQEDGAWRLHRDIWNSSRAAPAPLPPECAEACARIQAPGEAAAAPSQAVP